MRITASGTVRPHTCPLLHELGGWGQQEALQATCQRHAADHCGQQSALNAGIEPQCVGKPRAQAQLLQKPLLDLQPGERRAGCPQHVQH